MIDRKTEPLPVVHVFVRLPEDGSKDRRIVTFRIPPGVSKLKLLRDGWAIDGHQAQAELDDGGDGLTANLHRVESRLVATLEAAGLTADFR